MPVVKVQRRTETGDAPGWQGATKENPGTYVTEEQRSQAGCSAGRMPLDFHHGLLAACGPRTPRAAPSRGAPMHACLHVGGAARCTPARVEYWR